ncbi:DnaA ATPase domain-containing protein [Candidatus Synchoanobacter obligatus]|uniref:DnaA/Hda family protein n=1 Tax=Candidatus Synchoanobacter obligatus TaxID=2919597 RepID=A0ABT1L5J9_9GAMM|nr:DnaA/Hda family protein [Candidatus Synchoanobacter obligatus]MCP8352148.1 DnaA/Hda family protein [Candidatus Synchoanobacter obligatus]
MTHALQQTLDLSITSTKTFDNFTCPTNSDAKKMLEYYIKNPSESMIIIEGNQGTGKTHLLLAACHFFQQSGRRASFIPLRNPADIEMFFSQPIAGDLICIDDVHLATKHSDLEHNLFRLYNHAELSGSKLIWSKSSQCQFQRKDLQSREQSMLSIQLLPYTPNETYQILMQHLEQSQSTISGDICQLLIKDYTRNISKLLCKLKEIEAYAHSTQKKVTMKMARELIQADIHPLTA